MDDVESTGKQGDKVTLRYAELLKEDGHLYLDNLRGSKVTDTYILKGDEEETGNLNLYFMVSVMWK